MGKKNIVHAGNTLKTVQYAERHKINKKENGEKGRCSYCYEKTIFRVVKINRVNSLACTRCLKSARLYKTEALKNNRMFYKGVLTLTHKLARLFIRIETYFKGNLIFLPFKIRRKSKLGLKITNTIIKVKGLKDA